MHSAVASAVMTVFPLAVAAAATTDFMTMTIPNRVSLVLLLAFFVLGPLAGLDWSAFGMHLAAGGTVFVACFACFALNIMGGGDAKLLTATAVWFGFNPALIEFIAYVAAAGGALAMIILLLRSQENVLAAVGMRLPQSFLVARKIPYGIAIAVGGLLAFPSSVLFQKALEAF